MLAVLSFEGGVTGATEACLSLEKERRNESRQIEISEREGNDSRRTKR